MARAKREKSNCIYCGKELHKGQKKYCSNRCQQDYQQEQWELRWKNGEENGMCGEYGASARIRTYLFKKYDNKCSECGWGEVNKYTGKIPLEVDHLDGNYRNNVESNLTLICPNCHSLTATYKGANKSGRKPRKKYYKGYAKRADQ